MLFFCGFYKVFFICDFCGMEVFNVRFYGGVIFKQSVLLRKTGRRLSHRMCARVAKGVKKLLNAHNLYRTTTPIFHIAPALLQQKSKSFDLLFRRPLQNLISKFLKFQLCFQNLNYTCKVSTFHFNM